MWYYIRAVDKNTAHNNKKTKEVITMTNTTNYTNTTYNKSKHHIDRPIALYVFTAIILPLATIVLAALIYCGAMIGAQFFAAMWWAFALVGTAFAVLAVSWISVIKEYHNR